MYCDRNFDTIHEISVQKDKQDFFLKIIRLNFIYKWLPKRYVSYTESEIRLS